MPNKQRNILFLSVGLVFFTLLAWYIDKQSVKTTSELVAEAEKNLHAKEKLARNRLALLTEFLKDTPPRELFKQYEGSITDLYKREGIVIVAYQNDSLWFWSDNHVAFELNAYTAESDVQMIKLRNGWYEFIRQRDSLHPQYSGAALIAIKSEYDLENKYLNNEFMPWLGLPEHTDLRIPVIYFPFTVKSSEGIPLFEVVNKNGIYRSSESELATSVCAMLAFICLISLLVYGFRALFKDPNAFVVAATVAALLLRVLMIWLHLPASFYNTLLFDPSKFADANSFFFSSLGDVLINSILLFICSVIVYRHLDLSRLSRAWTLLAFCLSLAALLCLSCRIIFLIKSLVVNSTISYDINELFSLSWYSITAFMSVCILLFAFYVFVEKIITTVVFGFSAWLVIIVMVLYFCIYAMVLNGMGLSPAETAWPFVFLLISYLLRRFKASYNFINVGLLIIVAAGVASYQFNKYEKKNRLEKYQALSYKLSDRQDIIAENEFEKISNNIRSDNKLKNLISLLPLSVDQTEQRIRQVNFSGYFERYDVVLALFDKQCKPYFRSVRPEYQQEDYFQSQIDSSGVQTVSDDLYFIEKNSKKLRYIARINIDDASHTSEKQFVLYVQFEPLQVSDLGSFPDLLIDKSLESQLNLGNISYALYNSGRLISKYGDYNYTVLENRDYAANSTPGFNHYIFKNEPGTTVVITERKRGSWYRFTSISYFFVFFSVIVLFVIFLNSIIVNRRYFIRSLNTRIQFILVIIVVCSLAGVVIGTVWVVSSQSEEKNRKELLAKSQSVLMELRQTIGQQEKLDPNYKDYTSYVLKKLANLFGSDISMYDTDGRLFSTSRPGIYEQGLIARFMNPMAYSSFVRQDLADYSLKESIGSLNYLSAYMPFYNADNKLIGYLNLPYFSRQKDLEKELTVYLTTLINIYTILFAFTTLIALVVSNYLTKPLRLIKQQISKIGLGKYNERLRWNTNDEIGDLVNEYNSMLHKLEESSQLLARSERENAWREMAKQVAHEIKNPLTPMKLNIQHLQRVIETNPGDVNERVNKVAALLIEQIDTLTHIANEFSNFAKLPRATIETVNLTEVLQNVAALFRQDAHAEVQLHVEGPVYVLADREQTVRVFTNLLKNAGQAIPEDRKGYIQVSAVIEAGYVVISVKDNGVGIPEHLKPKIFTPNFTTKSAGTGLGLAMVKNIITSIDGSIWFESEVGKGTAFFIRLKLA